MTVACGLSGEDRSPTVPATTVAETPTPTPAGSRGVAAETRTRIVAVLASRPADMTGRARYAIRTYAVGKVDHPLVSSVEGVADFDQQRYSAQVVLFDPAAGSPTAPMEFFVVADRIYERVPRGWTTGTKRPNEIGSPLPLPPLLGYLHDGDVAAYAGDPAGRRALVEGLVSGIDLVGTDVLRGTSTERYRVRFDAPAATTRVPHHLLAEMDRWGESPGKGYLDLWLEEDRLRQFTSVTKPSDPSALSVRVEQEYWDYGGVPPLILPDGLPSGPR